MNQQVQNECLKLKLHMKQNNLDPDEPIVPDSQSHQYWKQNRGARYIATAYPLEDHPDNPTLICSYGWLDQSGGGFSYSSLMK